MAFEKRVPARLFGFNSDELVYVCLQMMPMGWAASAGIIQNFLRNIVHKSCMVDLSLEVRGGGKPFLIADAVVTCMDGFDKISRVYCESEFSRLAESKKMRR